MSVRDLIIMGCSSQQPTRFRSHIGSLLRWNNEGFLLDPGEGTQRQFIFANISPTTVTKILISHFHGDHCLGVGSMLIRLNLDKVTHPIHCFFPASGWKFFNRLRFGTSYHEKIEVIPHPVDKQGMVFQDDQFTIEAYPLIHGIDTLGWRIQEKPKRKYFQKRLQEAGIQGSSIRELIEHGVIVTPNGKFYLDDVSIVQKGDTFAYVTDTLLCENALRTAQNAQMLLCESTYLEKEKHLASQNFHMTAKEAATIAQKANVRNLVLTHFSARYADTHSFLTEASSVFAQTTLAEDLKVIPFHRTQKHPC